MTQGRGDSPQGGVTKLGNQQMEDPTLMSSRWGRGSWVV